MCRKHVFSFLALSLALLLLPAPAFSSPEAPSADSPTISPQPGPTLQTPEPTIEIPLSPFASRPSLPPEFWANWEALGQGLKKQIEIHEQLRQSATASLGLSQSETESTQSIGSSLSQASSALDQTSSSIASATASSEDTSAHLAQATTSATETDESIALTQDDIKAGQRDARALGIKIGLIRGAGVTITIGAAIFGGYKLGRALHLWK